MCVCVYITCVFLSSLIVFSNKIGPWNNVSLKTSEADC